MKKLLTLTAFIITINASAQKLHNKTKVHASPTITNKWGKYISLDVSISNGDTISLATYPSIEFGLSKENISLGLALGRNNFRFSDRDEIGRYYWEVKATASEQFGGVKGFILFGLGNYFTTGHVFIEYGSGILKSIKNTDFFIQVSNFDGVDYISLGVTFNF